MYATLKRILFDVNNKGYQRHKVDNNTYAHVINETQIGIRLHDTDVIVLNENGTFQLYTDGWFTNTTTNRMNMFTPAKVVTRDGSLFVLKDPYGKATKDNMISFNEGMKISASGIPL
jgi:hypothetical protein